MKLLVSLKELKCAETELTGAVTCVCPCVSGHYCGHSTGPSVTLAPYNSLTLGRLGEEMYRVEG